MEGSVDLHVEDAPPGPGTRLGTLWARVHGSGPIYRIETGGGEARYTDTGRRNTPTADLRPRYQHWAVGGSTGVLSGGPDAGAWEHGEAWWSPRDDGYALTVEDGPPDIDLLLPGPSSMEIVHPEAGEGAHLALYGWEVFYAGVATSGTATFERYSAPPAPDLFGEIAGRVEAVGRTGGDMPFDFTVAFDFVAPVWPEGGAAAQAAAGGGAEPILPFRRRVPPMDRR